MGDLSEIIKRRTNPGILIFDLDERLLYSNSEALDIMPVLQETMIKEGVLVPLVPEEVLVLCRSLKESRSGAAATGVIDQNCVVLNSGRGNPCSVRALDIGHHGERENPTHIMILVERIAERHDPDFDKAKLDFDLSKREMEVLKLICMGLSNKAISEKLFISEFTVKDHIKKIMLKMDVRSRGEINALLK
jgi:DNA-binding NarL/FixJ family response regulator